MRSSVISYDRSVLLAKTVTKVSPSAACFCFSACVLHKVHGKADSNCLFCLASLICIPLLPTSLSLNLWKCAYTPYINYTPPSSIKTNHVYYLVDFSLMSSRYTLTLSHQSSATKKNAFDSWTQKSTDIGKFSVSLTDTIPWRINGLSGVQRCSYPINGKDHATTASKISKHSFNTHSPLFSSFFLHNALCEQNYHPTAILSLLKPQTLKTNKPLLRKLSY